MNKKIYVKKVKEKKLNKWTSLVTKEVKYDKKKHIYYFIKSLDYISILAVMKNKKIPIVKQFRPAIEKYVWEFPGGLVDKKLSLKKIAIEEIEEETGLTVEKIIKIKTSYSDIGRIINKSHFFYAECSNKINPVKDKYIKVKFVSYNNLVKLIKKNKFQSPYHISLLTLAKIKDLAI